MSSTYSLNQFLTSLDEWVSTRIFPGRRGQKFMARVRRELELIFQLSTLIKTVLSVIAIAYVQTVLGRNLAFYRHAPIASYVGNDPNNVKHGLLRDVGHMFFEDRSADPVLQNQNNTPQHLAVVYIVGICTLPYIFDQMYTGFCEFYAFNMSLRFVYAHATGNILRMFFYLPTSLPGTAAHCFGETELSNRPKELHEVFYHPRTGVNCGDLMFSGHMLVLTTAACFGWYYLSKMISRSKAMLVTGLFIAMILVQIRFVLLTRSHYTADITSGIIVAYFQWQVHSYVWRPTEPQPKGGRLRSASETLDSEQEQQESNEHVVIQDGEQLVKPTLPKRGEH